MKLKAIIILLILISTLTVVYAADLNNLNLPDNFEKISNMTYNNKETGEKLDLIDVSEELNSFTVNETELREKVHPTNKENIYSFTDEINNMSYCGELIKVNEINYIVKISVKGNANESKIKNMTDTLTKFNELNNFTAVNPNTL
ncbi:MAG: hypothetical protein E7Z84_08485 [Methanosphaera stadtmanae]|nr:hypothetical protein [Methanosphaera stadtmanae]